jgi:hypothetical protein
MATHAGSVGWAVVEPGEHDFQRLVQSCRDISEVGTEVWSSCRDSNYFPYALLSLDGVSDRLRRDVRDTIARFPSSLAIDYLYIRARDNGSGIEEYYQLYAILK